MSSSSDWDIAKNYLPCTQDQLNTARGHAISQYAHLESALCNIFSLGFDTIEGRTVHHKRITHANFVFYKIGNYRARRDIINETIKSKSKSTRASFRNSYIKELQYIDETRNRISHWSIYRVGGDDETRHFLTPGRKSLRHHFISLEDLQIFAERLRLFHTVSALVTYSITGNYPNWAPEQACAQIFIEPIKYPVPEFHPLSRVWPEPNDPDQ